MSFTEDDFKKLSLDNRLQKVLFAIKNYLDKNDRSSLSINLLEWLIKYEDYPLKMPESLTQWEQVFLQLKEELFKINPYLEEHLFDQNNSKKIKKIPFKIVLEDIRSPFNVGAVMRSAGAFGANELLFCGYTPRPDHKRVVKTSRNVKIDWKSFKDCKKSVDYLRKMGYFIYGLDKTRHSENIHQTALNFPLAIVLGNEEFGISRDFLSHCDNIIHIPLCGFKNSINVSVAAGIAMYEVNNKFKKACLF